MDMGVKVDAKWPGHQLTQFATTFKLGNVTRLKDKVLSVNDDISNQSAYGLCWSCFLVCFPVRSGDA